MPTTNSPTANDESIPLEEFAEKAYLDYSMYVILDRALPHVADGLKPVQRRIIYAMSELRLHSNEKFKKSARTVGDVIGKFHPHGDTAAYEAMVLMAQPFSYRYPIIDGQGNWGSADDPKSFAAMRYTECRFTPYAQILLDELSKEKIYWIESGLPLFSGSGDSPSMEKKISKGTVDWTANFDGSLEEPQRLPAQLPNILLNGSTGIAVGMTANIPSHNLREVVSACIALLKKPTMTVEEICELIPGPDFPTEGIIITPRKELVETYKTGTGSVRMRAAWHKKKKSIVISALPYQVSGSKIMEQIAKQMLEKKLPMIVDLRDEGDEQNPTRLVLQLRGKNIDYERLMDYLFKTTELEKSYRIHLNMIGLDGKPKVHNLKQLLTDWLSFRKRTILRRLNSRLDFVLDRLHILDGLAIIYLNIDDVINIIRNEDKPKLVLMKRYSLSTRQVEAILDIRLRRLAKLEEIKIRNEQKVLQAENYELEKLINSPTRLRNLTIKELRACAKKHGDARRSLMQVMAPVKDISVEEFTPVEPVTVVLSANGWVRSGKGLSFELKYRAGDQYLCHVTGKSNEILLVIDETGRIYTVQLQDLPSLRSLGDPLTKFVSPPSNTRFTGMLLGKADGHCLLASSEGYGFVAKMAKLTTKNRAGKIVLTLKQASPFPLERVDSLSQSVVIITNTGRFLTYPVSSLPVRVKGKGVRLINIPRKAAQSGEKVSFVKIISDNETLKLHSGKRFFRLTKAQRERYLGNRNLRGKFLPRGYQKIHKIEIEST